MNSHPLTFVSFCVDIGRDKIEKTNPVFRDFSLYKQGLNENIETYMPLVVFTSVGNDAVIGQHRNNTNFLKYDFVESDIQKEFPNYSIYKEWYHKTKNKDLMAEAMINYAPLVVLKLKKIIDVIEENPFNSDHFFWIDSYFTRGMPIDNFISEEAVLNFSNKIIKKSEDKILMFLGNGDPILHKIKIDVSGPLVGFPFGFFWGGHKSALKHIYEKFINTFFQYLPEAILTEERIFYILIKKYPELFNIVNITPTEYKQQIIEYLNR